MRWIVFAVVIIAMAGTLLISALYGPSFFSGVLVALTMVFWMLRTLFRPRDPR